MTMPKSEGQFNFNTVVGVIVLACIGWVATSVSSTKDSVTKITTQLPFVTQSIDDVKKQLTQMVTHSELESRFAELTAKNAVLEAKLVVFDSRIRESENKRTK